MFSAAGRLAFCVCRRSSAILSSARGFTGYYSTSIIPRFRYTRTIFPVFQKTAVSSVRLCPGVYDVPCMENSSILSINPDFFYNCRMRNLILILGLCLSTVGAADSFTSWRQHSSASLVAEEDSVSPGQKTTLGFDVHLEKTWHTYWVNPGDSGAAVKLSLRGEVRRRSLDLLTGPIQFPIPDRLETGPITSFVYDNEVMFLADVVVPESVQAGERLDLILDAEWLVCQDVCIPAFETYRLELPVRKAEDVRPGPSAEAFTRWRGRLPRLQSGTIDDRRTESHTILKLPIPSDFSHYRYADFFPLRGSQLGHSKPELVKSETGSIELKLATRSVGERRPDLVGLLVLQSGKDKIGLQWGDPSYGFRAAEATESPTAPAPETDVPLVWVLLSAFIGGLILNLMPCVFPILSIKLFSVVKQAGRNLAAVRAQNFSYVVGVLAAFMAGGAALAGLRAAGHLVGWGFQLQSPIFVLLLSWLFFLLAVQLLGYFEIEWLNPNIGHQLTRKEGLAGSFFTGVLAVVVASPCTAPFMGVALGFALSQSLGILLAVFFLLGLGLGFPYLLFGIFPSWSRFLPKPGAWMQTLKEVMAFPLLLTCVWLVWLLAQLKGNLAAGLALTGMVGWFFVLWVRPRSRVLAYLAAAAVLALGALILREFPNAEVATGSDELHWQSFSDAALARQGNETVFVDFTADWCLTCKLNERLVFTQPEVIQLLKDRSVKLVKGDWTKQDAGITRFLNNYRRAGVPFYIAFGPGAPEGKIFPEVLTPEIFRREIENVMTKR